MKMQHPVKVANHIDLDLAIYKAREEQAKNYSGYGVNASSAASNCARSIWYDLRWATIVRHNGRMLRLFERGTREEAAVIADLERIGIWCVTHGDDGKQIVANNLNDWIRGKIDAHVPGHYLSSLPDGDGIVEIKTHGSKSFSKLSAAAGGVRIVKPEHYCQTQLYLHSKQYMWGIYVAVNKDNDELHIELIEYDRSYCENIIDNIIKIIQSDTAPDRIAKAADSYSCMYCNHKKVCHQIADGNASCRSCCHITADITKSPVDGGWHCERLGVPLEIVHQQSMCDHHISNPAFIAGKQIDGSLDIGDAHMVYDRSDGTQYTEKSGDKYRANQLDRANDSVGVSSDAYLGTARDYRPSRG